MQSSSVSRNFAQCLDAITLYVMYSFKGLGSGNWIYNVTFGQKIPKHRVVNH